MLCAVLTLLTLLSPFQFLRNRDPFLRDGHIFGSEASETNYQVQQIEIQDIPSYVLAYQTSFY